MQHLAKCICKGRRLPWALITALMLVTAARVYAGSWTLQKSIERAQSVSPVIEREKAALVSEQGKYEQSGVWPNPSLSVSAGDTLGQELQTNDIRVQNVQLMQPIPIGGRTAADAEAAEQAVSAARSGVTGASLSVAHEAARLYQRLQHAQARMAIAQRQTEQADRFDNIAQKRSESGDIAMREASRLSVLAAQADATLSDASRHRATVLERFRNLLDLSGGEDPEFETTLAISEPPRLSDLKSRLASHPELRQARQETESARARAREANASRIPDLNLTFSHKRFALRGEEENAYAVGLGVEVPLWTTYGGREAAARGRAEQANQAHREGRRELERQIATAYESLGRLMTRLERHEEQILEPSRKVVEQSEQGYRAGNVTLTELIDATNAVWQAERKRADLLLEARLAKLELKEAAGLAPGESMQ
ncbi:outer membrane protein TolC [Halospina denitrificans]|uniref:Outer membrane protein TolC n=1 Tax=Halospina denitrificans TaxID=332522 RepID=A0A4R7JXA1_9GAMM|nr:TolC family protein [Halospina denitrificans]TDT43092.1 outer membrane protein TolC [Halospina denitrificans]